MRDFRGLAIKAALEAGEKIMDVYQRDFTVQMKADNSPLTEADQQAHQVIKEILQASGLPVLSEEGKQKPYEERKLWNQFWLVDPLDGTKEFIKRNGEFTVNIALIRDGLPLLGVVYVPVTGMLYFGDEENGSFCCSYKKNPGQSLPEIIEQATRLPKQNGDAVYTIVASRSHLTPDTEDFIAQRKSIYKNINLISAGSSLKLCLVAEGKAQVYPRLAPTMEWDTAAGHAVAKYAQCRVYNFQSKNELQYNKENLLNPWFVVEREANQ